MYDIREEVEELRDFYSVASAALLRTYPFIGSVLPKLRVVYVPDREHIAGVDGTRIIIGRRFLSLTDEEKIGVLAHEALHLVLQHVSRCADKDPFACNVAGDAVINDMLMREIRLPDGVVTTDTLWRFGVVGVPKEKLQQMNMEEIYELLPKKWRLPMLPSIFPGFDVGPACPYCRRQGGSGQPQQNKNDASEKAEGKNKEGGNENKDEKGEGGASNKNKGKGEGKDKSKSQGGGGDKSQDDKPQSGSGSSKDEKQGGGGGSQDKESRDNKGGGNGERREKSKGGGGQQDREDKSGGGGKKDDKQEQGEGDGDETDYDGAYIINKGSKEIYGEGKTPTSEEAREEIKRKLVDALVKSYIMAKIAGSVPGHLEAELGSLGRSVINWRQKLRRSLVSSLGKVVETWVKPNRRVDEYPGVKRLSLKDVWVLIDVSGSISMDEFKQFMTEVYEIAKQFNAKVNIIEWDADVQKVVMHADKKYIPQVGRAGFGGTIIKPALRYVLEGNKLKYGSTVIIFSDWVLYDYGDPEVWRLLNKIAHTARLIEVTTYNSPIPIPTATVIKIPIETITTHPIPK